MDRPDSRAHGKAYNANEGSADLPRTARESHANFGVVDCECDLAARQHADADRTAVVRPPNDVERGEGGHRGRWCRAPGLCRGRVFSTFSAITTVAQPIGLAAGGFAIEAFGLKGTIVVLALAALSLGIAMLFIPALHDMNRRAPD